VAFRIENRADAAGCAPCAEFQPLDTYAAALRAAGFRAGTVVALSTRQEFPTAALRAAFPEARFVAIDYPLYAPPAGGGGDCLIVWNPATTPPPERAGAPVPRIGQPLPSDAVLGTVAGDLHLADRPADGMGFALVAGGLGSCR
jgi:hypothetical protein